MRRYEHFCAAKISAQGQFICPEAFSNQGSRKSVSFCPGASAPLRAFCRQAKPRRRADSLRPELFQIRVPAKASAFVGQRLAVVDVGDDREVADVVLFCHRIENLLCRAERRGIACFSFLFGGWFFCWQSNYSFFILRSSFACRAQVCCLVRDSAPCRAERPGTYSLFTIHSYLFRLQGNDLPSCPSCTPLLFFSMRRRRGAPCTV